MGAEVMDATWRCMLVKQLDALSSLGCGNHGSVEVGPVSSDP